MKIIFTEEGKRLFWDYFNAADEIYESTLPKSRWRDEQFQFPPLTLDDLDADFVARARKASEVFGLSWPPHLPEAEEFALDHKELNDG